MMITAKSSERQGEKKKKRKEKKKEKEKEREREREHQKHDYLYSSIIKTCISRHFFHNASAALE